MTTPRAAPPPRVFLSASWRNLAMLNFTIDPAILKPLIPSETELDLFQNRAYVSVVGFQFLDTKCSASRCYFIAPSRK